MPDTADSIPLHSVLVRTVNDIRAAVPEAPFFSSRTAISGYMAEEYRLAEGELPQGSFLLSHTIAHVRTAAPGASVSFCSNGYQQTRLVHAGDVFVRSFEEITVLRWNKPLGVQVLTIFPATLCRLAGRIGIQRAEFQSVHAQPDAHLSELIGALFLELSSGNGRGTTYSEAIATSVVVRAIAEYGMTPARRRNYKHGFTASITRGLLDHLCVNLDQQISIKTLANLAGYPPFVFQRLFFRTFGRSVHQFLLEYRAKEARRLMMSDPSLALSAVAARTGFAHQSHLSSVLRAQSHAAVSSL